MLQNSDYPYLYETHLHTCTSSRCAKNTPIEMMKACKEAGYTGAIITEHNWYGNHCVDEELAWADWITVFCKSYDEAKIWGEENDFDVFFGYEAFYGGAEFLIYGVNKEWLIAHPEIKDASTSEQYKLIHEAGGIIVQAHPFREASYIPEVRLFPEWVDGVEGINAAHSNRKSGNAGHEQWDEKAIAYAKKHRLPMTAGSDVHSTNIFGGGMAFKRRLHSIQDFCKAIREDDYLLTNGDDWFNKQGENL
ncbi:MAG: PHP domain-containing protein [Lachnospiraceae bacterium]|nr:PHP domain-containing protein [Lachnospiraceae bacterium]